MGLATKPMTLLLAGPTATGKTALAVELAARLGGEIISADSMQIYKGCVIGTAQPSAEELKGIPCHLVGCVEPWDTWTAADWLRATREIIKEIHGRKKAAIVAGGTGLYFKALTTGLFEAEGAGRNDEVRRKLESAWEADAGQSLRARLERVDPEAAERVHPHDKVRTVRALEVFEVTGKALSILQAEGREKHRPLAAHRFVLCAERTLLYHRIDARVLTMMEKGFAEEVRDLMSRGATEEWPAMRALGYPQMMRMMRGEMTRDAAIEETQRLSRRYAKQQMVLYRNWPGAVWLDIGAGCEKIARDVEIILEFGMKDDSN